MRIVILIVALAAAAMVSGAALSELRGQDSPRLKQISNPGSTVAAGDLSASQLAELTSSEVAVPSLRLLDNREGTRFYTAESTKGQPCFLTSRSDAPRREFSVVACLGAGEALVPSEDRPLVDFSAARRAPGSLLPEVQALTGFAADGVASVALVDEAGQLHSVPVRNNVYVSDELSGITAQALVALDRSGNVVYRRSASP